MEINQDLKDQLSLGFEKQRHRPDEDLRIQLMEADFCHDVNGEPNAYFTTEYIVMLMNKCGGIIKIYLKGRLRGYPSNKRPTLDAMYFNQYEIDFILEEIDYFMDNKRWREYINENNMD